MWEAIASNRRRSWLLIGLMGLILIGLGAVIGLAVIPPVGNHYFQQSDQPGFDPYVTGLYGAGIAMLIWLIMWAVAAGGGDSILLSAAGARKIEKDYAPQLWNTVEEMTIASGLGQMPKVYVIDDEAPNAFAVGYKPGRAAVAVTSGLLRRLNRDELQGVIAHEIGHVRNLDVRFMTMASVMVGSIVIISDIFLRSLWFGSGRRRRSSRGGGQAQIIFLVVAIVAAVLAPLCAQLLYFSCSRRREYLADASAARFTRYPEGLASALMKISRKGGEVKKVNRVVAPMYIVNPLQARAAVGLFSTHPPIEKRVKILRNMGGRAGFADYEAAFRQLEGKKAHCIGARTLASDQSVAARQSSAKPDSKQDAIERAREVGDMLAGLADFLFITCACGVRLKIPPNFTHSSLSCPRCGHKHDIPRASASSTQPAGTPGRPGGKPPLRFQRKSTGWESFKCSCGHVVQISPAFRAPTTNCHKCHRLIEIG